MNEFVPSEFYLGQNYPNPFNEKTTIKYCIAYKTRVRLSVYNSEGEEIEKLIDEEKKPGTYEIEFNAVTYHSREGGKLEGGTYLYSLEAGDYLSEKNMILER
jgi:5-hydroxyisourate hydrolase-like protein (transthyretin family)